MPCRIVSCSYPHPLHRWSAAEAYGRAPFSGRRLSLALCTNRQSTKVVDGSDQMKAASVGADTLHDFALVRFILCRVSSRAAACIPRTVRITFCLFLGETDMFPQVMWAPSASICHSTPTRREALRASVHTDWIWVEVERNSPSVSPVR